MLLLLHVATAAIAAEEETPPLGSCLWRDTSPALTARVHVQYEQAGSGIWRERHYQRLWRSELPENVAGQGGGATVLFGLQPAAVRGVAYLRWQYAADQRHDPDEWVYVPRLQKVRRATVRDAEDMVFRDVEDDLALAPVAIRVVGNVDSLPEREVASWLVTAELDGADRWKGTWWVTYERGNAAEPCRVVALEQRNNKGKRVRGIDMQWRHDGDVWYRAMLYFTDVPSGQRVSYHFSDVRIASDLSPSLFTQQALRGMPRMLHEGGWLKGDEP